MHVVFLKCSPYSDARAGEISGFVLCGGASVTSNDTKSSFDETAEINDSIDEPDRSDMFDSLTVILRFLLAASVMSCDLSFLNKK